VSFLERCSQIRRRRGFSTSPLYTHSLPLLPSLLVGTHRQFRLVVSKFGIETTYVDATDLSQVEAAIRDNTKVCDPVSCLTTSQYVQIDLFLLPNVAYLLLYCPFTFHSIATHIATMLQVQTNAVPPLLNFLLHVA
jgi:hypothetical protein